MKRTHRHRVEPFLYIFFAFINRIRHERYTLRKKKKKKEKKLRGDFAKNSALRRRLQRTTAIVISIYLWGSSNRICGRHTPLLRCKNDKCVGETEKEREKCEQNEVREKKSDSTRLIRGMKFLKN